LGIIALGGRGKIPTSRPKSAREMGHPARLKSGPSQNHL
jgi:hypothetical protein